MILRRVFSDAGCFDCSRVIHSMNDLRKKQAIHDMNDLRKKQFQLFWILMLVFFCLLAMGMPASDFGGSREGLATVEGKIVKIVNDNFEYGDMQPGHIGHIQSFKPVRYFTSTDFTYQFEHDGKPYSRTYSSRKCFFDSCTRMERLQVSGGGAVTVYFESSNPNNNWPLPPPKYSDIQIGAFLLTLCVVASAVLSHYLVRL